MWRDYFRASSLEHAAQLLAEHGAAARIIAGGTDMLVELERGVRKACHLIDLSTAPGLNAITRRTDGGLQLGPLTTHNDVVASAACREQALALVLACREVGAPQIRNRATVAGNCVTASPANDTITALMALDARVVLHNTARGDRELALKDFYLGVRKTVLQPDELMRAIILPAQPAGAQSTYLKLGLRKAQAISVVNCAIWLQRAPDGIVLDARITLGAVAPTIARAVVAEQALIGRLLDASAIAAAAQGARMAATPIDDVRASAVYREAMAGVLVQRALQHLQNNAPQGDWDGQSVQLALANPPANEIKAGQAHVNGQPFAIDDAGAHKTLLRFLREDCGLIGTKEGCAEGECGACTVLMDGRAVMSCMVPAPRAQGAHIVTIEGIGNGDELHPLQDAFITHHAVQCGYCTPGFIMSGAALFAETANPSREQIKEAISGNLCRCTGYYKILEAFDAVRAG